MPVFSQTARKIQWALNSVLRWSCWLVVVWYLRKFDAV